MPCFHMPPYCTARSLVTECVVRNSDACLQASPDWNSNYICIESKKWCNSWAKDMWRCCPETCNAGPLTVAQCDALDAKGTCAYPNEAQCSGENRLAQHTKRSRKNDLHHATLIRFALDRILLHRLPPEGQQHLPSAKSTMGHEIQMRLFDRMVQQLGKGHAAMLP